MSHRFVYPADIEVDEAGFHMISFPDVPEAGTDAESPEEARAEATDALVAALGGYVLEGRDIPRPSPTGEGQMEVFLPPLVAAKLALYQAMRDQSVSKSELARRLEISEGAVRRLLDLDHRSKIEKIETALECLDQHLVIESA